MIARWKAAVIQEYSRAEMWSSWIIVGAATPSVLRVR